jgi:nucleotide-binding universal stress UspA family protein
VAQLACSEASVAVIAALEPYPSSGVTIPVDENAAEVRRRKRDLDDAEALLARHGLDASTRLVTGDPAHALIEAAAEADLLVVGSRGLSRLHSLVLGSVSSKVVAGAPCDVLVVRWADRAGM